MKGRKHLHLVDKKMRGTARADRINRNAPVPQSEPPRAPAELSKRATEIFGTLVGRLQCIRMASATDTELLALLATRLEEYELCTENIRLNGSTYAKIELCPQTIVFIAIYDLALIDCARSVTSLSKRLQGPIRNLGWLCA